VVATATGVARQKEPLVNSKQMFVSFIPWIAFSFLAERHGASGATAACLIATALSLFLAVKNSQTSGWKLIDVVGVVTFGVMTAVAATGSSTTDAHVIDYGRGTSALVLGAVMLVSVLFVPFTEQYARDSVPREHWNSPIFRSINRRISAVWALAILGMGCGHLLAGYVDPNSAPAAGARPVDLLLNWIVPALLIVGAINLTNKIVASTTSTPDLAPAGQ
jgi:hypothetical protein